ncbi:unnamed protein product [Clonostachys rosea]|uniref:Nucleoside phosphorylase domain-containing protein n=1 Tax=Bionectria ochroleuca TaxID=29856 RepID=A0ABY6UCN4_BIOOC|nr:unnamed protein product [Clonostachys rosea]
MPPQLDTNQRSHNEYTVGWVCALPKEQTAAIAMLDERHGPLPKPPNDCNTYSLGSIGGHNIVIACLPQGKIGTNSAAAVATRLSSTFPSIKVGLMVGIGGGIPPKVRLGDVVVSSPSGRYPGVVQWDIGKAEEGGTFRQTGSLNNPPVSLLTALTTLQSENELYGSQIPDYLHEMEQKWPRLKSKYTWSSSLVDPSVAGEESHSQLENINIHYGLIASGNQVIKDATFRDSLDQRFDGDVLCLEMEAAGLINFFPCLVIRGICDYADSQKNNEWQEYAAALSAAFAKELLQYVQTSDIDEERPVKDILEEVLDSTSAIQVEIKHIRSKLDGNDDIEILNWLAATNYGLQQSDYFSRRQPDTGTWFLESDDFKSWLAKSKQTLFCHGIPGAGKTILTSVVVDHLSSRFNSVETGIAYIYCNFKKYEDQKIENLLQSVLRQLAEGQSALAASVKDLYQKFKLRRPPLDGIIQALQSVIELYSRTFIMIDALDECQALDGCRGRLMSELLELQTKTGCNVYATSRFIPEIVNRFKGATHIEIRAHNEDIRKYLQRQITDYDLEILQKNSDTIQEKLIKKVDGMFLLAKLYFDAIRTKKTDNQIQEILASIPVGPTAYDDAYEKAMSRIKDRDDGSIELAKPVLMWITCAKRQLSKDELRHALAVKGGKSELNPGDMVNVQDMVSSCAGLVTVEESGIIRLVHQTTQEYFERTQGYWFPNVQANVASVCLTYLSFETFNNGACDYYQEYRRRLKRNPFYSYAAQHWDFHADQANNVSEEILKFLVREAHVEAAFQVLEGGWSGSSAPKDITGLHLAAHLGMTDATGALLRLGHDVNSADSFGRTSLWYASRKGDGAIVELLLAEGAVTHQVYSELCLSFDESKGFRASALNIAIHGGHEQVVQKLVAAGADVNLAAEGEAALFVAAKIGNQGIVEMLLAAGADVNLNHGGWTAIQGATKGGHQKIVDQLIAAGADVNKRGDFATSALVEAIVIRHQQIAQTLLAAGAEVNDYCYYFENDWPDVTALEIAVRFGYEEFVSMLLAAGANMDALNTESLWEDLRIEAEFGDNLDVVNTIFATGLITTDKGLDYRSHLTSEGIIPKAARGGNKKIVEKLLEEGGNVDDEDEEGYTSLARAAEGGYQELVMMLLRKGADVNAGRRSPLAVAALRGRKKVVEILLQAGADIEFQGSDALRFAARGGHQEIVEMLLLAGAYVKPQGSSCGLAGACAKGNEEIVEMLLAAGADTNDIDGGYQFEDEAEDHKSALEGAAFYGHSQIVDRLLAVGVEVNFQRNFSTYPDGYTALHAAVRGGQQHITDNLLEAGANPELLDVEGKTALQTAAEKGVEGTVNSLLARGADVNATGRNEPALASAVRAGHQDIVKRLLRAGAEPNAFDHHGLPFLSLAAEGGFKEIVTMLLAAGAEVNTESRGWCCGGQGGGGCKGRWCMYGRRSGPTSIHGLLGGKTALQAAAEHGHEAIFCQLLEAGANLQVDGWKTLRSAAGGGHLRIVNKLLIAGVDINLGPVDTDKVLWTPLCLAAQNGHLDVVERLLKAGADVNATRNGRTAIQLASERGYPAIFKRLVAAGADPTKVDYERREYEEHDPYVLD